MRGVSPERTLAFSDGVFAIAITLLVLNVEIPDIHQETLNELQQALDDTIPDLVSYFIGFFVIGRFWVVHHRFFDSLRGYDERLMMANLVYLSLIALLPFPTAVLSDHTSLTVGVVLYAVCVAAAGLAETLMLWLALRRRMLGADEQADPGATLRRSLWLPLMFIASIPVGFLEPRLCPVIWVATLFVRIGVRRARIAPQP